MDAVWILERLLIGFLIILGFGVFSYFFLRMKTEPASEKRPDVDWGLLKPEIICPHCHKKGSVLAEGVERKKGISGGKATGAVLTIGVSLLLVGLSRTERMTQAHCENCDSTWDF